MIKQKRSKGSTLSSTIAFLLLFIVLISFPACRRPKPDHYNVIFMTLDTTRADYIDTGTAEGARAFTPALRRFAKDAIVCDRAFCTIPQTLPSHLSMLTSYFPRELGVLGNENPYDGRFKMLPQVFKENRYHTAGIISLGTLGSKTGFARGFDEFHENLNKPGVFFAPAQKVTNEAISILNRIKDDRFFFFIHYSDPHTPYAPPDVNNHFTLSIDGKPVSQFNAYWGAILKMEIPLTAGEHTVDLKLAHPTTDFEFFVLRRLKLSENCKVVDQKNIEYSEKYYNGSFLFRGQEGRLRVKARGAGTMKLFQVIPILKRESAVNYYRRETEYMDIHVGRLLKFLNDSRLLDHTIVVITADHGEGLGERDGYFAHLKYLNQQFIRVPLMIHLPGMDPGRIADPVSLSWLPSALLEFTGIDATGFKNRHLLLPLIQNEKPKTNGNSHPIYSYVFKPSAGEDRLSIIQWPYQCILNYGADNRPDREFYNLALSPSFRRMDEYAMEVLMKRSPLAYRFFQQACGRAKTLFLSPVSTRTSADNNQIENLKSIGYLE
ncbi:MAG: sulfatase [Candidatus Omnitrophota bacterium]